MPYCHIFLQNQLTITVPLSDLLEKKKTCHSIKSLKYFSLLLGLLKSSISKISTEVQVTKVNCYCYIKCRVCIWVQTKTVLDTWSDMVYVLEGVIQGLDTTLFVDE